MGSPKKKTTTTKSEKPAKASIVYRVTAETDEQIRDFAKTKGVGLTDAIAMIVKTAFSRKAALAKYAAKQAAKKAKKEEKAEEKAELACYGPRHVREQGDRNIR